MTHFYRHSLQLEHTDHAIPLPKEFSHKQKPDSKQKKKRKKNKSQNIRVSRPSSLAKAGIVYHL
jgi:hypothetical protein